MVLQNKRKVLITEKKKMDLEAKRYSSPQQNDSEYVSLDPDTRAGTGLGAGEGNRAPHLLPSHPLTGLEANVICHLSVPDEFLPRGLEAATALQDRQAGAGRGKGGDLGAAASS